MTQTITIKLTDAEYKAMSMIAYDPVEWIQNVSQNRARKAIDEVAGIIIDAKIENGESIQSTKEELVLNSTLPTAKEQMDAMDNEPDDLL